MDYKVIFKDKRRAFSVLATDCKDEREAPIKAMELLKRKKSAYKEEYFESLEVLEVTELRRA